MRRLALVLLLLAGCDRVFGLDTVRADAATDATAGSGDASIAGTCGSPGPNQEIVATSATGATVIDARPTAAGSTLVLVAALASKTDTLASVTDDAHNTWRQGAHSASTGASAIAVELWFATGTQPATKITALSSGTNLVAAMNFTEWPCALTMPDGAGAASSGVTPTAPALTGMVTTSHPTLVIGAVVLPDGTSNPARATTGFTDLTMFFASLVYGAGVWAWKPPGTYSATWDLEGTSDWVGSIMALSAAR